MRTMIVVVVIIADVTVPLGLNVLRLHLSLSSISFLFGFLFYCISIPFHSIPFLCIVGDDCIFSISTIDKRKFDEAVFQD